MRRTIIVLLVLLLVMAGREAAADVVLFTGKTSTPSSRPVKGVAVDAVLLIIGVEFEYSDTNEDMAVDAPSLRTAMFNAVVQTPSILGLRFYATAGGGLYEERLTSTNYKKRGVGTNTGGGVKIPVVGPIGLRVDYRLFSLRGGALHETVQRFYMGANLSF